MGIIIRAGGNGTISRQLHQLWISITVVFLGLVAFSCCVAAEFRKAKAKDMKVDGSLCSVPRSPAFGLGISAVVCLFLAQIVGTSSAATGLCLCKRGGRRAQLLPLAVALLLLSWVSFGLAAVMVGAGSSMNGGQGYGGGWLEGQCYIVKDGVYVGAAVLVAVTVLFVLGFIITTATGVRPTPRTGPADLLLFQDKINKNENSSSSPSHDDRESPLDKEPTSCARVKDHLPSTTNIHA